MGYRGTRETGVPLLQPCGLTEGGQPCAQTQIPEQGARGAALHKSRCSRGSVLPRGPLPVHTGYLCLRNEGVVAAASSGPAQTCPL